MIRRALQISLPLALLALGALSFSTLRGMAAVPERHEAAPVAAPVQVVTVAFGDHPSVIEATGSVQAAARLELIPQVAGKVTDVTPGLTPGLRVRKGQVIASIDPRDFEAQIVQAEAAVAQATAEVALESSRGQQATREWEMLGTAPESALARREPQAATVRANLAAAEARLDLAKLALERTKLTAPFDAVVLAESLEPGQVVAPGAPVATLIGTQRWRVRVSLPVADVALLDVPATQGERGSPARVRQPLGNGASLEADGYVLRLLGELDAESRTATLLVAIDDPLNVPEGQTPILPGAYVDVTLQGRTLSRMATVPRVALQEGRWVWLASADDKLVRREVTVGWTDADTAYVSAGLHEGERVITTPLALPVEGMPLAVQPTSAPTP
jgi:RND family efflux transporter MFP subunit